MTKSTENCGSVSFTEEIFNGKLNFLFSVITYERKTFENPNLVDVKSVITELPKTSHELSKTIRQTEKVGFNSSLYSDTK